MIANQHQTELIFSQASCPSAKVMGESIQPGQIAMRSIDDLSFEVLILRVDGHVVDVVYVDDGNLEKSIPLEEVDWQTSDRMLSPKQQQILEAGLEKLGEEPDSGPTRPTTSNMRWEQGRHKEEDGAVILSNCISVLTPEAVKDGAVVQAYGNGLRGIRSLRKHRFEAAPVAA
eukprot:s1215_g9.t1